jgi:hypothetical protein
LPDPIETRLQIGAGRGIGPDVAKPDGIGGTALLDKFGNACHQASGIVIRAGEHIAILRPGIRQPAQNAQARHLRQHHRPQKHKLAAAVAGNNKRPARMAGSQCVQQPGRTPIIALEENGGILSFVFEFTPKRGTGLQ